MKTNWKTQTYLKLALLLVLGLQVSFPWMKDGLKQLDLASEETYTEVGQSTVRVCGVDHNFKYFFPQGENNLRIGLGDAGIDDGALESACPQCTSQRMEYLGQPLPNFTRESLANALGLSDLSAENIADISSAVLVSLIDSAARERVEDAYGDRCGEVASAEEEVEASGDRDRDRDRRLTERQRDEIFSCNLIEDSSEDDGVRRPTVDEKASCRLSLLSDIAEGRVDRDDLEGTRYDNMTSAREYRDFIRDLAAPTEDLVEELLESDDSGDVEDGIRMARELERAVLRTYRPSAARNLMGDGARRLRSSSFEDYRENYSERMQARITQGEYRRSFADISGEIDDLNGQSDRLFDRYGRYNEFARDLIERGLEVHTNGTMADKIRFNAEMADLRRVRPEYVDAVNSFLRQHDTLWSGRESALDRLEGLSTEELAALSEYSRIFGTDIIGGYRDDFHSLYDQVARVGIMTDDVRRGTYRPDGLSISNLYETRSTLGLSALGGQSLQTALPQPGIGWSSSEVRNIMTRMPADPMRTRAAGTRTLEAGRSIPRAGMPVRTL